MPPTDLQQAVLAIVRRPKYVPSKPKAIAKKLGLNQEQARDLKRVIKSLVKQGLLQYGPNHFVLPVRSDDDAEELAASKSAERTRQPRADDAEADSAAQASGASSADTSSKGKNTVTGVFRRAAGGFGFVRPQSPLASAKADRSADIFVPAKHTGDAASGDTVLVRVKKSRDRGRDSLEGEIIDVIERETNTFVGVYLEDGGQALVDVDGKIFKQPISIGDPGAKGVRAGDKVVIEMVRFPSQTHDGEGVLIKVLGARGAPGVDTLSIIHEFGLPMDFPAEVLDDARRQADAFDESIEGDRRDRTDRTTITIDPVDARDFDDAICLTRLENGHWQLGVHIADVSHFVPRKTVLDQEARNRATSVYLPDRVIPMLPEIISNNLASLQPDRVRYTMTAEIEFTAEGVFVDCDVFPAAIRSRRRFTYEEVDEYLDDRDAWKEKLKPEVHQLIGDMHELAMILRRRRFARGSLELTMPEIKIDLDRDGNVSGAHSVVNTESHQIIEEFMLAANEAVAERLARAEIPFMRRIHENPDPRKLKALSEFVRELGFKTESLESRFATQDLLAAVEGLPQQQAVNYAVLRSMQKAIYSPIDEGHYALASPCYCHFTSPIRRYPDLTIHRLLKQMVQGKTPEQNLEELHAEAAHCSDREQRATGAERELVKVKLLLYMSTRIGDEMEGVITGVEKFGLFVVGTEIPAEGFIHISALQDDYYSFDRVTHSLTGHRQGNAYRLGDRVRVTVASVDVDSRELDFRLLGRAGESGGGKRTRNSPRRQNDRSARGKKR